MSEQQANLQHALDASLALKQAKIKSLLFQPIPSWPEKLSTFLISIFVVSTFSPPDSPLAKTVGAASLAFAFAAQWYLIGILRKKVEALIVVKADVGA